MDEVFALLDVLLELGDGLGQQFLLEGVQLAHSKVLLDAILAQHERSGEILSLGDVRANVGALDDVLLALDGADEGNGEASSGISHRESRRSGSSLGLDDLSSSLLNALCECFDLLRREIHGWIALRQQRHDGDARVSADDWQVHFMWVATESLSDKSVSTDDIQCGNAEHSTRVQHAGLGESLAGDRNCRVHRVRDDADECFRAGFGAGGCQVAHNRCIGVEEIVASHSWLAWNAGWDDDDVGI